MNLCWVIVATTLAGRDVIVSPMHTCMNHGICEASLSSVLAAADPRYTDLRCLSVPTEEDEHDSR